MSHIVSVSREVAAPAEVIFDLLADPRRHHEIDGSGMVRGAQPDGPDRLHLGARFGMAMRAGARYKILNTVSEFEEGRRIAWHHFGGHEWRYLLQPVDDHRTVVTEQFDPTRSRSPLVLRLIGARRRNLAAIEGTLDRLQHWAADRSTDPGPPRAG